MPPITSSPSPTSTGTGSPVIIEVSTAELPATITPSLGTRSPGRTTTRMPTSRSSTATSVPSSRRAVRAPSSSSRLIAWDERPLARCSNTRPRMMAVMIAAAVSK